MGRELEELWIFGEEVVSLPTRGGERAEQQLDRGLAGALGLAT
jgi:hypothetical protein